MITPLKIYLLLGAILVIVIGVVLALFMGPAQPVGQQGSTTFPTASSTNQSGGWIPGGTDAAATSSPLVIGGSGNAQITVRDFLHNGVTASDPENLGTYYLAGKAGYCISQGVCPAGATSTDFTITYDAAKQFFTIALTAEPIGPARIAAQAFLEATLGLDDQAVCALRYYVGTTFWVNALYDDKNLGFSFCPGATPLPQ